MLNKTGIAVKIVGDTQSNYMVILHDGDKQKSLYAKEGVAQKR